MYMKKTTKNVPRTRIDELIGAWDYFCYSPFLQIVEVKAELEKEKMKSAELETKNNVLQAHLAEHNVSNTDVF